MENTTLACTFMGCTHQVSAQKAMVPAIQAIKQAEGGKNPSPADVAKHIYCEEHAQIARSAVQIRMYSYLETVREVERRSKERAEARAFFAKYAVSEAPKPNPGKPVNNRNRNGNGTKDNVMRIALQKAGLQTVKPKGEKVLAIASSQ
jgi:hypothetical protein